MMIMMYAYSRLRKFEENVIQGSNINSMSMYECRMNAGC